MSSTVTELQNRVDALEAILRDRDRQAAEDRAATLAAQQTTDAAKDVEARTAAAAAEREQIRRGAWLAHLLGQAVADAPVDFAAMDQQVPAAGWPPGADESNYVFTGGAVPKEQDVANTALGRALASLTKTI